MNKFFIMLSGLLLALGVTLNASAADSAEGQQLQTAEEIETLLEHLGLFDSEVAFAEESEFEIQRRNRGHRRPPVRSRPPHRRPPVHRRPPHRRPPVRRHPPHRPPPRSRWTTCYAESQYGYRYAYSAYSPWVAQQGAMDQCYRYSRYCYQIGCYTR